MKLFNEVGCWNVTDTILHVQETTKTACEKEIFNRGFTDLA